VLTNNTQPDLSPEEQQLALALDAMEKSRRLAATEGDMLRLAEIDAWFRQYAHVIRPLRDKLESAEFDDGK